MRAQADKLDDSRPWVGTVESGNPGVQVQRATRPALIDWFRQLQERLFKVVVINRPWESLVTPAILGQGESTAVFLDPPYRTDRRSGNLYHSDIAGESDDTATACYEWAVEHGETYRIAYCQQEGDFPVPDGWTSTERLFGRRSQRARKVDQVLYSPTCLDDRQSSMF